jgi:hypothetical protein
MYFRGINPPRNNDLPPLPIISGHELGNGLSRAQPLMDAIIVSDPNLFFIRVSKIDSRDWAPVTALQLSQPLVGDVEIACDRDCEDTGREVADRAAHAPNAITTN